MSGSDNCFSFLNSQIMLKCWPTKKSGLKKGWEAQVRVSSGELLMSSSVLRTILQLVPLCRKSRSGVQMSRSSVYWEANSDNRNQFEHVRSQHNPVQCPVWRLESAVAAAHASQRFCTATFVYRKDFVLQRFCTAHFSRFLPHTSHPFQFHDFRCPHWLCGRLSSSIFTLFHFHNFPRQRYFIVWIKGVNIVTNWKSLKFCTSSLPDIPWTVKLDTVSNFPFSKV